MERTLGLKVRGVLRRWTARRRNVYAALARRGQKAWRPAWRLPPPSPFSHATYLLAHSFGRTNRPLGQQTRCVAQRFFT